MKISFPAITLHYACTDFMCSTEMLDAHNCNGMATDYIKSKIINTNLRMKIKNKNILLFVCIDFLLMCAR